MTLEQATTGQLEVLLRAKETERSAYQRAISQAGGPSAWLKKHCPRLSRSLGETLSEHELTELLGSNTEAYWLHIEQRAQLCARCSMLQPGQCASTESCLDRGMRPMWSAPDKRIVLRSCEEWREFSMHESLNRSSVPPRYWRWTERARLALGEKQLGSLVDGWLLGNDERWLIMVGSEQALVTEMLTGLVRWTKERCIEKSAREPIIHYAQLAQLIQPLLGFFKRDNRDAVDPLAQLRTSEIVFFDEVYPEDQRDWFKKAVQDLLYHRWQHKMATVLGPSEPRRLDAAYPWLRGAFDGAVRMNLDIVRQYHDENLDRDTDMDELSPSLNPHELHIPAASRDRRIR